MHPDWGLSLGVDNLVYVKQGSRGGREARINFRGGIEEWESGSLILGPSSAIY